MRRKKHAVFATVMSLALAATVILPPYSACALAQASSDNGSPSGTLLIPIAPKIDYSKPTPDPAPNQPAATTPAQPAVDDQASMPGESPSNGDDQTSDAQDMPKSSAEKISAEQGSDGAAGLPDDAVLKGSIQMVADDTEYDQDKNTFLGTGNAVVIMANQDSKLEADTILYDQTNQLIDCRGNVHIYRNGQLTTGSAFKFKVTSDEYLITNPDTEISGTTIISRKGYGTKAGMLFKNGTMALPGAIRISTNGNYGPSPQETVERSQHPGEFTVGKQSYVFTARKMIYERYKSENNLTIYGGKLRIGNFDVPMTLPKFTMTVGQKDSRVTFPITPLITNNLQMGGTSVGPQYNFDIGKRRMFYVAPMVQFGGLTTDTKSASPFGNNFGPAIQLGFRSDMATAHFAYGSVSNLVVADFKYRLSKNLQFQSGVNRFLTDGIYGYTRARLIAELVHTKTFGSIPYIASLTFRTAGGWAQDDPTLLNLTPAYAALFKITHPGKESAYRLQEQITATSQPLFNVGDDKYGIKMMLYGGAGLKAYSTGDTLSILQAGPNFDIRLDRLKLRAGYTQSAESGKSPFVFDQYIAGTRSVYAGADYKVNKYLTLGASGGYNLQSKLMYQKTISAAIGPDDFKLLVMHDMIQGQDRYGFDLLFGQPIPYKSLLVKNGIDAGQLGVMGGM